MKIALVELADARGRTAAPLAWNHGPATRSARHADAIARAVDTVLAASPDLVLTWDADFGTPDVDALRRIAATPGDVWHAGLRLGQRGRPELLDTVHPTWMLARDAPPDVAASSWRLDLRACLFRPRVYRQLGGPDPGYLTLRGCSLELGHRWLWGGAILRHAPSLLAQDAARGARSSGALPLSDQFRFLHQRSGRFWATWALVRGVLGRRFTPLAALPWWRERSAERTDVSPLGGPRDDRPDDLGAAPRVTVLIPTVDRYPYLRVVLEQLGRQTVPPHQVIVVDQTDAARRGDGDWRRQPGLPLEVIERDRPGQSSARNAGLRRATGDVILFIDDDIEMDDDLIARHLEVLRRTGADASCGVTEEFGAGPLPADFRFVRVSDVFPTCNSALRRRALERSGLFDLAFDRGARADADLGTRLYLSGALMLLSPAISVLHHKAPAGGLRRHKARIATYAASRASLVRHLPSVTEIYLARRYGGRRAAREMLWQRVVGTLRARGPWKRRLIKLLWGLALLPDSLVRTAARLRAARAMLDEYPQIPELPPTTSTSPAERDGASDRRPGPP